jgi:hypothetical protein
MYPQTPVRFVHLYEEVYGAFMDMYPNHIILPQNFVPVVGQPYTNLRLQFTKTGEYTFQGKTYYLIRAHHPDYDEKGNPFDSVADDKDVLDHTRCGKSVSPKNRIRGVEKLMDLLPKRLTGDFERHDLTRGSVVARQLYQFDNGMVEMRPLFIQETDRPSKKHEGVNTSMIRIREHHDLRTDLWILSDDGKSGLACFCDEPIKNPDNVIGFMIEGVAKSGKVAFATPVYGDIKGLMTYYYPGKLNEDKAKAFIEEKASGEGGQ